MKLYEAIRLGFERNPDVRESMLYYLTKGDDYGFCSDEKSACAMGFALLGLYSFDEAYKLLYGELSTRHAATIIAEALVDKGVETTAEQVRLASLKHCGGIPALKIAEDLENGLY